MNETRSNRIELPPAAAPLAGATRLPNLLTYARIAAVPAMVACLYFPGDGPRWTALAIFVVAALTDFIDGWIARRWGQQTSLGRMLDPIADKLLVAAALLMLVGAGTIHGPHLLAAVLILCREVLVSGLREFLATLKVPVPVTQLAKWKTALQLAAIGFLIAGETGDKVMPYTTEVGLVGLWVAAILTLFTGLDYLKASLEHLKGGGA